MSEYSKIKSMVKIFKSYGIEYPSKVKRLDLKRNLDLREFLLGA